MPVSINILRQWRETALDIVLPPTCALCGGDPQPRGGKLCGPCLELLASHRQPRVCSRCAMPVALENKPDGRGGRNRFPRCYHCQKRSFAFRRALAFGLYEGTLREAVLATKQAAHAPLMLALGELLAETLRGPLQADLPARVVAVPSHWSRRVRRGGSPSQWLAESVGRSLAIQPTQTLRCIRRTQKQGTLAPEQRAQNVRGAFRAKRGYAFGSSGREVRGMHVLLVDDVLTTGSTGHAAATALRAAGARCVTLAVLARATG